MKYILQNCKASEKSACSAFCHRNALNILIILKLAIKLIFLPSGNSLVFFNQRFKVRDVIIFQINDEIVFCHGVPGGINNSIFIIATDYISQSAGDDVFTVNVGFEK